MTHWLTMNNHPSNPHSHPFRILSTSKSWAPNGAAINAANISGMMRRRSKLLVSTSGWNSDQPLVACLVHTHMSSVLNPQHRPFKILVSHISGQVNPRTTHHPTWFLSNFHGLSMKKSGDFGEPSQSQTVSGVSAPGRPNAAWKMQWKCPIVRWFS